MSLTKAIRTQLESDGILQPQTAAKSKRPPRVVPVEAAEFRGLKSLLLEWQHGLGDTVELSVVLRHLRHHRPDLAVDVRCEPELRALLRGLCRRTLDPKELLLEGQYDRVHRLPWREPEACFIDAPSGKPFACIMDEFGMAPVRELFSYRLERDAACEKWAEDWLSGVCQQPRSRRYPVVLLHYQGRTVGENKDLPHAVVAKAVDAIKAAGFLPVLIDQEGKSPLLKSDVSLARYGGDDPSCLLSVADRAAACVGIDSGPGHIFGATETPTILAWTLHHPVNYYSLAGNVLHLVPANHANLVRGNHADRAIQFFDTNYRHAVYQDVTHELVRNLDRLLRGGPERKPLPDLKVLPRLAACSPHCDQLVGRICTMSGRDVHVEARAPDAHCPMGRWPGDAPRVREPAELRHALRDQTLLLRFPHGMGDHVQLTSVLAHLKRRYPKLTIDLAVRRGCEGMFAGMVRRAMTLTTENAADYQMAATLLWREPHETFADSPSTKVERCLREVFGIVPDSELAGYAVSYSDDQSRAAAEYLESIGAAGRGVLLHYQGRCGPRLKNLEESEARAIAQAVLKSGGVPIVLDWSGRGAAAGVPGCFNAARDPKLWGGEIGDASVIAALAARSVLTIGVDSGPGHVFSAVAGTPCWRLWKLLHPVNYCCPGEHIRHWVPQGHERFIRGGRDAGAAYFADHYQSTVYRSLESELVQAIQGELPGMLESRKAGGGPADGGVLFLDDRQARVDAFLAEFPDAMVAMTAKQAIARLQRGEWESVYLDHDLNDCVTVPDADKEANNGLEVARWIVANRPRVRQIVVHSTNQHAAEQMVAEMRAAGLPAEHKPFHSQGWGQRPAGRQWHNLTSTAFDREYYEQHVAGGLDYASYGPWQQQYGQWLTDTMGLRGKAMLDVGCACGSIPAGFAVAGVQATGIDVSEHMIRLGREKFPHVRLEVCDGANLHYFKPESFDFVHSHQSAEHWPPALVPHVLEELYRVARRGARFFCVLDTVELGHRQGRNLAADDPTHVCIMPYAWWLDQLKRAGWTIETESYRHALLDHGWSYLPNYDWDWWVAVKPE